MQLKFPEKNKKPNICYAVTDDGVELPVIDVTHPAFQISLDESGLDALLQQFLQDVKAPEKIPAFLRNLMFSFMRRRSIIMRGLMGASGTFMSGMNTYMMKLGADNLNKDFFSDIDRRLAGSSAGTYMRLRLQDIAHLLADALITPLDARRKATLHLLNIGGGSAMDSLNALILIRKAQPNLLAGRQIFIHSLDLDTAGADFGARALASLLAENSPLHGLQINFQHVPYNWSDQTQLRDLVKSFDDTCVIAASSEGALFEYGSDEDITGNLQTLNETAPADAIIAGSVTRADDLGRMANGGNMSRAAIQFRGLEAFTALASHAGWNVAKKIDRPLSNDVLLKKV
ncbi:MAG: hypothetical protein M1282_11710 [Chloroflexi bacterium]|nr:hypothetical protein [Chloroflexota bacterium]